MSSSPDDAELALRRAISLVTMRAGAAHVPVDVPSPCISVCRMNEASKLCEGCFRTSAEIGLWSRASDGEKRAVWTLIEQRMTQLSHTLCDRSGFC